MFLDGVFGELDTRRDRPLIFGVVNLGLSYLLMNHASMHSIGILNLTFTLGSTKDVGDPAHPYGSSTS
jgi:hypothetical protein